MDTETETYNAYQLANMADCASPDSLTSPGATFLERVQDGVRESISYMGDDFSGTRADRVYDMTHEIADSAADLIYTRRIWETFLDLAAYQEYDELVDDYGLEGMQGGGGNYQGMEQMAVLCLYRIAERLATALLEEAIENLSDDDDETED